MQKGWRFCFSFPSLTRCPWSRDEGQRELGRSVGTVFPGAGVKLSTAAVCEQGLYSQRAADGGDNGAPGGPAARKTRARSHGDRPPRPASLRDPRTPCNGWSSTAERGSCLDQGSQGWRGAESGSRGVAFWCRRVDHGSTTSREGRLPRGKEVLE
ncbi:hypothetical protein VULLAG_LOCUS21689 [Vulpes lagopus]